MKLCFPESVLNQLSAPSCTSCCASIVGLLLLCCPMTVTWFVVSVIVFAIYRVKVTRAFSHILEECLEATIPAWTHRNSSPTVGGIILRFWRITPVLELFPSGIFWSLCHVMSAVGHRCAFSLKAAAGKNLFTEMVLSHDRCVPAITFASPESMTLAPCGLFSNHKATESLSRQINVSLSHTAVKLNLWGEK